MSPIIEAYELTYFNDTTYDYSNAKVLNVDWRLVGAILGTFCMLYIIYTLCSQLCRNARRYRYYRAENL